MRVQPATLPLVAVLLVTVTAGPGAAEEAPLLPPNLFFANPDASWDYRVSPDGTRLAWIAMNRGRATLHFRRLDETTARIVETPREARAPWPGADTYGWSRDGKRLLFLMDGNGDENAHLFAVDTDAVDPVARDLTPLDGVRVQLVRALSDDPNAVIVSHTGRTGRMFDLYRLNLTTGQLALFAEIPATFAGGRCRRPIACACASGACRTPAGSPRSLMAWAAGARRSAALTEITCASSGIR